MREQDDRSRLDAVLEGIHSALEGEELVCPGTADITGGDRADHERMVQAVETECPDALEWAEGGGYEWVEVVVVVDPDGRVTDVRLRDPSWPARPEVLECLRNALAGPVFPCLAGYEVCPEYVILE